MLWVVWYYFLMRVCIVNGKMRSTSAIRKSDHISSQGQMGPTHDNDIFYSIKVIFTFRTCLCNTVKDKKNSLFLSRKHQILTYKEENIDFHLFSTTKRPAPNKRFCSGGAQTNPSMWIVWCQVPSTMKFKLLQI